MKTYSWEWKCSAKRLRFARAWKNSCVCDENLLAGIKMLHETLTFRETSRKILDIYVSTALYLLFYVWFLCTNLNICYLGLHLSIWVYIYVSGFTFKYLRLDLVITNSALLSTSS
jgi:hypothetical protein